MTVDVRAITIATRAIDFHRRCQFHIRTDTQSVADIFRCLSPTSEAVCATCADRFCFETIRDELIDFIATDIYRIANGRVAENWHLEDNLTLLQQLGLVAK